MNKITKEFLESEIIAVEYQRLSERLTHCTITVRNGFEFTGESVCVDPANYNEEIGNKIAYNNAFDKMWMPYGFLLRQKMHDEGALSNVIDGGKMDDETEDEPYQIKDTDQFTLELAIALAQNGDAVRSVNTGTVLTPDDCGQDALWELAEEPKSEDWLDRLAVECADLGERIGKLDKFIHGEKPSNVSDKQWELIGQQWVEMNSYHAILIKRLNDANGIVEAENSIDEEAKV